MKNKLLSVVLVAVGGVLSTTTVSAGEGRGLVEIGAVGNWGPGRDVVFFQTAIHINRPACNTYYQRWLLDISTTMGRAQYATLLAAQASGRSVTVMGSNTCNLWPDSETAWWVGFEVDYSKYPSN